MDYINLKETDLQRQKLNRMFEETEDKADLHMRLTEMLKAKSEEYNQITNRIDKLLTKLNGERRKRVENKEKANASVLSLVELFQNEEERKRMIMISELQKRRVKTEVEKLETMEDWKAIVFGIGKDEVI